MARLSAVLVPPLLLLVLLVSPADVVRQVAAADPDPLADFVVAGKNATTATGSDFVLRGLNQVIVPPGVGSNVGAAVPETLPGLESQGLAYVYFAYAPCGQVPPHTHPRASEILYVLEGQLYAGFVDTNNKLFDATLNPGDVFTFPRGLVHFHQNVNPGQPAAALGALNSQNPGVQLIGPTLFGEGGLPSSIVQVALDQGANTIANLRATFPASGNAVGTAATGCPAAASAPATAPSPGSRKIL